LASQVGIANVALGKLGSSSISNLDDPSPGAEAVKAVWDYARDAELRAHPWKFAITRGTITNLTAAPAWGYSYQYQLPTGYLRVVEINRDWWWDNWERAPWQIEGKRILTDIGSPLELRWLQRVTAASDFAPDFVPVLACRIALETCVRITGSDSLKETIRADYALALRSARATDAIERSPEPMRDGSWITGRV
jgi:hypothetical protein